MRWIMAGAIAAVALFAPDDANAYCRSTSCRATATTPCPTDEDMCPTTGAKLFWPTSCLSYATNRLGTRYYDPNDTRAIIRLAFQAWTDVKCADGKTAKMAFVEKDPIPCKRSEYNKTSPNVNVVLFQDDTWKYRGIDGTLAKTSVTYNDETGEIYDADIEVNAAYNEVTIDDFEIEYDLQAILTHEVGHFIGIAHSPLSTAVMYASYSPGSIAQRQLSDDDIAAVCGVYPPDSKQACNSEPKNGYGERCDEPAESEGVCSMQPASGTASSGVLSVFTVSGLLAAGARRRRRTRNRSRELGGS